MTLHRFATFSIHLTQQAEHALSQWIEPCLGCDLISAGAIRELRSDGTHLHLHLHLHNELGFPAEGYRESLSRAVKALLLAHTNAASVEIEIEWAVSAASITRQTLPGVKHMIAVASGKGGVGKSTTAVNLALALAAEGASVGVLDADIYGPSQPIMLGIRGRPESRDGKTLEPMEGHGIQAMSIGFLIDPDTPMVWRGPMVTQALEQLLNDTKWREIDYLVVDLPPGTGDIQLTLAQRVPVTGAIIVTTPQDIALIDARKGLKMFEKVGIPILGLVENMSTHVCSKCGHEERIFGEGGAERMGKDYDVEVLGALPLDLQIREQADSGRPTVVSDPDGHVAQLYKRIARRVAVKIGEKAQDHSAAFPKIVIQNT